MFRCDWHYDDILEEKAIIQNVSAPIVVMPVDVRNPMTEDDIDCYLITKFPLKQIVSQKDGSFHNLLKTCATLSLVLQLRIVCEISLKKVFPSLAFPLANDPRLYPHQSKYHYRYSGFNVESSDNNSYSVFCAHNHLLLE